MMGIRFIRRRSMRSTGRGISEGGMSGRGGWGRRESTTGMGKGIVGRVEGAERRVLRRGERLGGAVRRGQVVVGKGIVGRIEGAESQWTVEWAEGAQSAGTVLRGK